MIANPELISKAKKLAQDNYETWGQWIVECCDDNELALDLANFNTLEEWVDVRISVANILEERSSYGGA